MGNDDFSLPAVRDDRAAESIAVRLTRDVFAVRELVTALEQAVATLPAQLNRNGVEQGKQLAELVRKPLADARTALEKSTAAAIAVNADATTAIYEASAAIAVHASDLANALRAFHDAKGQIADAATVSVRAEVDRYGALSARAEERAGQVVQALHKARIADLRELVILGVAVVGIIGLVCLLLVATWEVFGKNIEKPYFCVGPDYTKCYSQLPHRIAYIDGMAPDTVAVSPASPGPVSSLRRKHRTK